MIKKIRDWYNKRQEEKLLDWISTHDIKYEKYKFFYGDLVIDLIEKLNYLSNIDDYIYGFIEDGGQLVYAYDKDIYQKVKELKKQCIFYCFTENQYETKLNYLIEKKEYIPPASYFTTEDGGIVHVSTYRYVPYFWDKKPKRDDIDIIFGNHKYLWVGSKTLEKDIEKCKQKGIEYKLTIQKQLIEVLK